MAELKGGEEVREMNVSIGCQRERIEMESSSVPNDGKRVAKAAQEVGWEDFKMSEPAETIGKGIQEMTAESKLRSERASKQREDGTSNSLAALAPQKFVTCHTSLLDGSNYHCWANQIETSLKELNVAYVLYEQSPGFMVGAEANTITDAESEAAEKWQKDDSLCCLMIFNNLSADLRCHYSKKMTVTTAKQLWEELKSAYETKRPLVKQYMEFQILEGEKPIVEQVEEFNSLCMSIISAGMFFDAKLHVSFIVSKLPSSWKDLCIKLMQEEYLPLPIFMDHLRVAEDSCIKGKQGMSSTVVLSPTRETDTEVKWEALKKNNPAVEGTDKNDITGVTVESKLRNQTGDGMPNSVEVDLAPQKIVPVDTVRFGGEDYPVWAHQMEVLLKDLNVGYVLYEACPRIVVGPEATSEEKAQSKAAEQNWVKDDSVCFNMILYHLSDDLFQHYSKGKKANTTARKLWQDLKLRFGTKRMLLEMYIEFQMFEGKPVVEQVQEVNSVCRSLNVSGIAISEKFHVSVVIFKLPGSWKDLSTRLMHEECLSIAVLMDRLRVEEECHIKGMSSGLVLPPASKMSKYTMEGSREQEAADGKGILCF